MISQKKWAQMREEYYACGGEFPDEFIKFIPDDLLKNPNISAHTLAMAMMAAYNAKKGSICINRYEGNPLDEIMALSEAAAAWNIPATTLQGYCLGKNSGKRKKADTVGKRNYFLPDEARKCGGRAWIVTKAAMYRLFGPPAEDRTDGVRKTGKEAE